MNIDSIQNYANLLLPLVSLAIFLIAVFYMIFRKYKLPGLDTWLQQNGLPPDSKEKIRNGFRVSSSTKGGASYKHYFQHIRKQKGRYGTETYWQCKTIAQMPYVVPGGLIYATNGISLPYFGLFGKYRGLYKIKLNKFDFDTNYKLYTRDMSTLQNQKLISALDSMVDINAEKLEINNQRVELKWRLIPASDSLNIFRSEDASNSNKNNISSSNINMLNRCMELLDKISQVY